MPVAGTAQQVAQHLRAGDAVAASGLAAAAVTAVLGRPVVSLTFTTDSYSLNSVSGRVVLDDGADRFFKFHTEEGEESGGVGEYYRAELLAAAGLPVEVPIASSTVPGEQMVVYPVRDRPRLVDVCHLIEQEAAKGDDPDGARLPEPLLDAVRRLHGTVGDVLVRTLAPPDPTSAGEAIHQLFHHRLTDRDGAFPGGRYARWYLARSAWREVADLPWTIDGVRYDTTLRQAVERAAALLEPTALGRGPVVTAHGDDHHGNVWVLGTDREPRLSLFDPAFASSRIPALLAPVKATYHNVFAHPFWLYHPQEAAGHLPVDVRITDRVELTSRGGPDGTVRRTAGIAGLSPLRAQVLASLTTHVWRPLLTALAAGPGLPPDWRATVRAGLLASPLLVTDLLAPDRAPSVLWQGLAHVIAAGAEPAAGQGGDVISRWLDDLSGAADGPMTTT